MNIERAVWAYDGSRTIAEFPALLETVYRVALRNVPLQAHLFPLTRSLAHAVAPETVEIKSILLVPFHDPDTGAPGARFASKQDQDTFATFVFATEI